MNSRLPSLTSVTLKLACIQAIIPQFHEIAFGPEADHRLDFGFGKIQQFEVILPNDHGL